MSSPVASGVPDSGNPLGLLSVRDLAKVFGLTEDAIRKRIRLRQIGPVIRQGRGYVMRVETLRRFFEQAERAWGPPPRFGPPV